MFPTVGRASAFKFNLSKEFLAAAEHHAHGVSEKVYTSLRAPLIVVNRCCGGKLFL
jgi:hypothetical protein